MHSEWRDVTGRRSEGRSQFELRRRCGTVDVDREFRLFVFVQKEDHRQWVSETWVVPPEVMLRCFLAAKMSIFAYNSYYAIRRKDGVCLSRTFGIEALFIELLKESGYA